MSDKKSFSSDPMPGVDDFISNNKSNKSNQDKIKPKPKKKSGKKLKPRTLLWDDEHFEMLNEISRVTMVPKQRILRNILNPGIEKMYKKTMESE